MNLFISILIVILIAFFIIERRKFKNLDKMIADMKGELENLSKKLALKKKELNSIVSSISEGIIILNKDGRVSFYNESFEKIFNFKNPQDRFYWEVIRNPEINYLIEKVKKENIDFKKEIEHKGSSFLVRVFSLPEGEEMIVSFWDLSEIKRLEKIKRDFIGNVSHELRTPLTAIKGYVETLEEEAEEDKKQYIEIIKKHTDRLMNIVQDLLALSELEEKGERLEKEEVDLKKLIENVLRIFKQKAEEKGLALNFFSQEVPLIKADILKLEQVFINLIDNAIKYTDEGEISIFLKKENNYIKIEVKDTGIGIPKEHLDRIFERFYVVDKSRSKRLGGTGLGLSIVKHIVLLHKGKIDVESQLGQGSKFTVTLPIIPS